MTHNAVAGDDVKFAVFLPSVVAVFGFKSEEKVWPCTPSPACPDYIINRPARDQNISIFFSCFLISFFLSVPESSGMLKAGIGGDCWLVVSVELSIWNFIRRDRIPIAPSTTPISFN